MEKEFRILVVDDDKNLASNLQRIVEAEGYSTAVAHDGATTLTLCREQAFDLALIDIRLPDMEGTQLVEELVGLSPATEYIIVTGYASLDSAVEAVGQRKIVGYEAKPIDTDHLLSLIRQITERKQAEEALRESEERYRGIFNESVAAIYVFDAGKHFIDTNQAGLDLLGYSREELLAMSIPDVDADPLVVLPAHEQFLSGERLINYEHQLKRKDGRIITVLNNSRPLTHTHGNVIGMQSTLIDITERKRAEEELERSRQQLRNLSAHLQSAREVERTSVAREIHDELGQALTALRMDLSWLGKKLSGEQEPLVDKIESMSELVGQTIQTVKRISTELRPGVLDDLGLVAAIEWQVDEFQNRTGIKSGLSPGLNDIQTDRQTATTVFRILQETLTNIARHAQATRASVSLRHRSGTLVLRVKDNGVGITTAQISSATSFGLMGMHERAYSHGGEFTISAVPGKGTTVTVKIPLSRQEETQ